METGLTLYKSLAVAEGRRSAANVPAVVESLNGVEKAVFTASTGKMAMLGTSNWL